MLPARPLWIDGLGGNFSAPRGAAAAREPASLYVLRQIHGSLRELG